VKPFWIDFNITFSPVDIKLNGGNMPAEFDTAICVPSSASLRTALIPPAFARRVTPRGKLTGSVIDNNCPGMTRDVTLASPSDPV